MRISLAGPTTTLGLILAFAAPAGAAAPLPDDFAGMNAQWVFTAPRASWDAHLSAMAAGGVRGVRSDATWAAVEPNPPVNGVHAYNWSTTDAVEHAGHVDDDDVAMRSEPGIGRELARADLELQFRRRAISRATHPAL